MKFLRFLIIGKSETSLSACFRVHTYEKQKCKDWTVLWVAESFRFQLLKGCFGAGSRMRAGDVVEENLRHLENL